MESKPLRLMTLIILLSHLSSLTVLFAIPAEAACILTASAGRLESLASLLGSFAFTMAGFLAAVLALFGIMSGSSVLAKYQRRGHLTTLLLTIGVTILELAITFILSVRLFFVIPTQGYIYFLAWLVATNLIMVLLSTFPIVMLVKGTIESTDHDIAPRC